MKSIVIPATPHRGHVEVEYLAQLFDAVDEASGFGATLVIRERATGDAAVQVPKCALDSLFLTSGAIHQEDVVMGFTQDMVQYTVYGGPVGQRVVLTRVTFYGPFHCPIEEERFALRVKKGKGLN